MAAPILSGALVGRLVLMRARRHRKAIREARRAIVKSVRKTRIALRTKRTGPGWLRWKAKMRRLEANATATASQTATIGFHDRRMAGLAATHEFGSSKTKPPTPERPAFRNGVSQAKDALGPVMRRSFEGAMLLRGKVSLERAALTVLREIESAYQSPGGPPLSERQEKRKAGTPGRGKKLVGTRGPKLLSHLSARVNGREVG